jgi:hypothetical protein
MILDVNFPIEIIRTNRTKSASIQIDGDTVKVIVPKKLSDKRIEDLVLQRTPWIRQKLKLQSEIVTPNPKEYVNGEAFTYLGRNYRLKLISKGEEGVKLKNGYLQVSHPKALSGEKLRDFVHTSLEGWYKAHALNRLAEKTQRYSQMLGVSPNTIKTRDYKSRWGSCSVSGEISYNWRIIIAPHRIVDYVVVHELCHMLEHNHSPKYWRQVGSIIPDYKECRDWLKANGTGLFA